MSNEAKLGYPDVIDPGITPEEADRLLREDCQSRLRELIAAMDMRRPVPTAKVALLIKHIVKDQKMTVDAGLLAGQMRIDHWERDLDNGDNLDVLAERARVFFDTHEGIELYNFFIQVFARTEEKMF